MRNPRGCTSDHFFSYYKKISASNQLCKQLIYETDSPYLAMTKDERNEPANVALAVEKLAELHEISVDDVSIQTEKNARYVFDI